MVGDPLPSAAYNGSVALFFNLISKTDFQNISKNLTHIHRIGKNFAYFIFFKILLIVRILQNFYILYLHKQYKELVKKDPQEKSTFSYFFLGKTIIVRK